MRHQSSLAAAFLLEVCMGMGLTGIPLVPWDCHRNGNHCDSIMGMRMGIKAWEWKLNNGNVNGFPLYLFSIKSTLSSCMYANVQQFWLDKSMLPKLYAVARKVLCVPAPSAASERVFSTAGRHLEKRRTSRLSVCLSVCPSVRLSVCGVPRHNWRTERPRKPKFSRMEAHHTRKQ